ncbi:class II aaRS and biotin synthetase [Cantharellus anzutake]|uniref:class II aaRS and biotin synthetase n=1 Tax=Cantharellus anzutake TaxID=1750568 RepID=UPI0019073F45|nr:class II aaRS and biotin synthetase [Cantharellus anzutake]KAF8327396.1 class II aaRS and biotin synthetase [Cantharellus anzutake]
MNVLVYSGPGVSETSLRHTIYTLKSLLEPAYSVQTITPIALTSQPWTANCALLVIPGGRDVPYVSSLSPAVQQIRSYVERGGSFLGLCAGAYFGSGRVEWEVGTEFEVVGDRPLRFFPGTCKGCVFKGFEYDSEAGAGAVELKLSKELGINHDNFLRYIYYNGGGHFVGADDLASRGVVPLLRYTTPAAEKLVAAVSCSVNQGVALLSSVHIEFPLTSEPAKSCISKEYPSLSTRDIHAADNSRKETVRNMLRILRLWVPEEAHRRADRPYPQLLINGSSFDHLGESFLTALKNDLFAPNANGAQRYHVLQDHNDTFHIYRQPDISGLIEDARHPALLESEQPTSFPKTIAICPAKTFPSLSDTPLFDIPTYFSHLSEAQKTLPKKSTSTHRLGELLLYGEVVTSTQTLLDKNPILLRSLPIPLVSLASYQLAGKGRGGNTWVGPKGSLALSIVLRPPKGTISFPSLVFIQYLAGLAVTETCREIMGPLGEQVRLKWPNDIYAHESGNHGVEGRRALKLGGVLVSNDISGGEVTIVVGIGLNVLNDRPTTSLAQLIPSPPNSLTLERTTAVLIAKFEQFWEEFLNNKGSFSTFMDLYLERWLHSDQLVTLASATPPIKVRLVGITADHGLLRAVPEDRGVARVQPYIDLQPDGNSFDMLKGLIQVKQSRI